MFNFGIFAKAKDNVKDDLIKMSPEERSRDYKNAIANNDMKRIAEHEELIESVMKNLGF